MVAGGIELNKDKKNICLPRAMRISQRGQSQQKTPTAAATTTGKTAAAPQMETETVHWEKLRALEQLNMKIKNIRNNL